MVCRVISSCPICPQVRLSTKPHGHLTPHEAPIAPWSEVHVDCIGPWTVTINNVKLRFEALTCIDPITNLVEISHFQGPKTSETAKALFENQWLALYPRPICIVHDNGPKFTGHDFQFRLDYAGITPVRITPYTPTTNAIIESIHRTIGQVIRTLIHLKPPQSTADANSVVDEALATAMHSCCCTPNTSLGNFSPGALVFQHDMFLDLHLVADLLTLTQHRQALINCCLLRANARRIFHEYKVNDLVFLHVHAPDSKLSLVRTGPFPILQVHTNNMVTVKRGPIHERISIHHIELFKPT